MPNFINGHLAEWLKQRIANPDFVSSSPMVISSLCADGLIHYIECTDVYEQRVSQLAYRREMGFESPMHTTFGKSFAVYALVHQQLHEESEKAENIVCCGLKCK